MRFDDTNPAKENAEFEDIILEVSTTISLFLFDFDPYTLHTCYRLHSLDNID